MSKLSIRGIGAVALAVFAVGLVAPGSAQAATTWTKTANTTQNAYSANGYKAKVGPSAAPAVSGYSAYSKTVSIKNSAGTYVAKGVTSKWLGKGTYKVYSTFKYRKKVAYTATVNQSASAYLDDLTNAKCTLTSLNPDGSGYWYSGTAHCSGTYQGHAVSGSVTNDYIDSSVAGNSDVGNTFASGDALFNEFTYDWTDWSYKAQVTKYKYVYAANRYRYRYATVKKILNPPTASYAEFKQIVAPFSGGYGTTLAQVRAIIGSNGTRTSFTDYGTQIIYFYEWKNNVGSTMHVGFSNGHAYTKTWYTW